MVVPLIAAYCLASLTNSLLPMNLTTDSRSFISIPFFSKYSIKECDASTDPDVNPVATAPAIGPPSIEAPKPAAKLLDIGAEDVANISPINPNISPSRVASPIIPKVSPRLSACARLLKVVL